MDKLGYDQPQTNHQAVVNPEAAAAAPPAVLLKNEDFVPTETKSKGNGFWRGCCAGWCCYCCLDACF
ncbi:Protein CYSTEINE-RICH TRANSMEMBRANE MODULE 4 [Euphorbia peplus]|nr:Protein CYSTEINE-RICH TRANSMEMBRANE MODULE 4 [Euphorbia peplus]